MKTKIILSRITAWALTFAMVFALILALTLTVSAADFSGSGWEFDSATGTLTVTTNEGTTAWRSERGDNFEPIDVKNVVIGEGVTALGDEAFQGTGITSIEIPDRVTSIAILTV